MPENLVQIGVEVDLKKLTAGLAEGKAAVQEHTNDMAQQFKKLAKESQTALDDLKKAAKLSGLEISSEMESVLAQVPKVASGLSALFSGGGVLAFLGVLIGVATALKGLYDEVIALKGAKEEWAEIDKKLADAEDTLQAKLRKDAIEYVRLTQGQAAAAHTALKLADKELVELSKNVDQILAGKKIDKLSEGMRKDLENLKHFTFAELPGKIKDVDEVLKRADENVKKLNDRFLKVAGMAPMFGDLGKAVLAYFGASVEKAEGERKALQGVRQELKLTEDQHAAAEKNAKIAAGKLDAEQQMRGFKEKLQKQKDDLDAFHTLSKQAEIKYWDDIIATHKVKGQNLKEVQRLRWEAQKEGDRKALEDEIASVQKNVAANKAGSQERVKILNDEIAQMEKHGQTQTAEYKHLVDERDQAVEDAARKELKDEVAKVEAEVKETKAGSHERIKIIHDEIEKLKQERKTETEEFKRLEREEAQAVRDLAKAVEDAYQERRKSAQQDLQAESAMAQSHLEFERQIGKLSESAFEDQMRTEINATFEKARKKLAIERDRYRQDTKEFEKAAADVKKLEEKHNADIEKLEQKSYLRRRQQFDQYFKQISSSFNTALNSWMQGTQTASQAFGKMFQDILNQLIGFVEQWIEKKIEMWLMDKLLSDDAQSKQVKQHISGDVKQIQADAFLAAAGASAANAAFGPVAMAKAGAIAFAMVTAFAAGAGALSAAKFELGGIVPQTGLALVHKGETILPASMSGKGFESAIGGGNTVHVHMNVNAIDSASFKDTVGKHGHMIGELVTKALKKKGMK